MKRIIQKKKVLFRLVFFAVQKPIRHKVLNVVSLENGTDFLLLSETRQLTAVLCFLHKTTHTN